MAAARGLQELAGRPLADATLGLAMGQVCYDASLCGRLGCLQADCFGVCANCASRMLLPTSAVSSLQAMPCLKASSESGHGPCLLSGC